MTDYSELVKALRWCSVDEYVPCTGCPMDEETHGTGCFNIMHQRAAAVIEDLQAEVKRLQGKLCDWCAVCPKERRNPDDCELLGENPVMYGPSGAKMEVQDGN